jgi:hypothetical protein
MVMRMCKSTYLVVDRLVFFSIEKAAGMTNGWQCHVPGGSKRVRDVMPRA